ncbi:MAG: hypothetical protein PCFJNLEI_00066 [Verrucomicrobiae bacterium]|nr:hypothetical protein [Verrucomicrobiae bacterium]
MTSLRLDRLLCDQVNLRRLDPAADRAGLLVCSLPVPRTGTPLLNLGGRPTTNLPLGQWPREPAGRPRRQLLIADSGGAAAAEVRVGAGMVAPIGAVPEVELETFQVSPTPQFFWERSLVRIRWGGMSVGLALGLKTRGEVHWWEACRLVTRAVTPTCRVIEVGGAIPRDVTLLADMQKYPGYKNPYLHHHNWLNGHLYARLHANGVCEVFAHHINSKFFDEGGVLEDVVPVLGIRAPGKLAGSWTGEQGEFALGPVRFDVREVARLATPEQPGAMWAADDFLVWQPYAGVDWFGGLCPLEQTGDPYIVRAEQRIFPRGMARTLQFSFSLSPDRSPVVARYLAPAWWYGVCEEFLPAALLPVANEYDRSLDACRNYLQRSTQPRGFEAGSMARHERGAGERPEPSWEGETPYGLLLNAWKSGQAADYDLALRAAYYVSDVAVDHAAKLVRMHGYPPPAIALPMARIHATFAAWLETGDPYLRDTALAVLDNSYWLHKNSWPRMAMGRDASFIRGAVFLYRYLGDEHYRELALDAARDVVASQRPNGSFGDQGGGSGIHAWAAYITKPWMGLMAVGGLLDYLEVVGDEPELVATVKRFADWLMAERHDRNGVLGWSYQHDYNGGRTFTNLFTGTPVSLPSPERWHVDYLARFLTFCSLQFNDARYFDAWAVSYAVHPTHRDSDHACAQSLQYLPWVQAKLWGARLTEQGVEYHPVGFGPCQAVLQTPDGPVAVERKVAAC